MYSLIEAWQQSGQQQSVFCQGHRISQATFRYWVSKRNKELQHQKAQQQPGPGFVPAKFDAPHPRATYKIEYPNGVCLHCPGATGHLQLKKLIQLY